MMFLHSCLLLLLLLIHTIIGAARKFDGRYFTGTSSSNDTSYIELLDVARRMISTSDELYQTTAGTLDYGENAFAEGAQWAGNIWTQNTYGFGFAAAPFLNTAQTAQLENSFHWWFDHAGDGMQFYGGLPDVPAGMLCDNGSPVGCNYMQCGPGRSATLTQRFAPSKTRDTIEKMKQRPTDPNLHDTAGLGHDFVIEGSLAGYIMQSEFVLSTRNITAAKIFMKFAQRISNFMETRRVQDESPLTKGAAGLFYAGNGANLLAPAFGGQGLPAGCDYQRYNRNCSKPGQPACCVQSGFSYLSALTITYSGLLDRMIEIEKFTYGESRVCTKPNHDTGPNKFCLELWKSRRKANDNSIPAVLVNTSMSTRYFLKALSPDGEKHGTYTPREPCSLDQPCPPSSRHGYFEVSPNVDAIALSVVDSDLASELYQSMLNIGTSLNPCGFTLSNFPDYDDMASTDDGGFGTWVSGGSWSTLEGRVILAHYDQQRYDLAQASMERLKYPYAELFKMGNPIAHQGCGPGMYSQNIPGSILDVDVFGIPAAFLKGLFKYIYGSSTLTLVPRMPSDLIEITQKFPIKWGNGYLYLSMIRKGYKSIIHRKNITITDVIADVTINGTSCPSCVHNNNVVLTWDETKYNGVSTKIIIELNDASRNSDKLRDSHDSDFVSKSVDSMASNWAASRESFMYSSNKLNTIEVPNNCVPNASLESQSKNLTSFRNSMKNAGLDRRFEYVQAGDSLIALNHSIIRCIGRHDGSIKPIPLEPEAWKNYTMIYNQSLVETYFQDVYLRLFRGLNSSIASYDRSNALPVQKQILQLYRGNSKAIHHDVSKRRKNIEYLDHEILSLSQSLEKLKLQRQREMIEM